MTIWMFYRKFVDEGNNSLDNPSIYNIVGRQYVVDQSTTPTTGRFR